MTYARDEIVRVGPLGGAQEWEWYQLQQGRGANVPVQLHLRTPTAVPEAVNTIREVLGRHEALHSVFSVDESGRPIQLVRKSVEFELEQRACAGAADVEDFDMSLRSREFIVDSPTFVRVGLALSDSQVTDVLLVISHAFIDGFSCRLLFRDLDAAFHPNSSAPAVAHAPHEPPRFLDSAISESTGPLARQRSAAFRFWQGEIERIPPRLFTPRTGGIIERYGSEYESTQAPAALVLAARRFSSTPAAIYVSLSCVIAAILSDSSTAVVRNHFAGRTAEELKTIGCYHAILPVAVDFSDRPSLALAIARASSKILRVQARSRIGYLQMRELIASWERGRGIEFAHGVTVNFDYHHDWSAIEKETNGTLERLFGNGHEEKLLMGAYITDDDPDGFDAYLHTRLSDKSMIAYGTFNHDALTPDQMRTFLLGPEMILRRALADGDLSWAGIQRILGV